MSQEILNKAITEKTLLCPLCKKPVQKYEKFIEMASGVWDGSGDATVKFAGSKVTLICGNDSCQWRERTEYWKNYINDD